MALPSHRRYVIVGAGIHGLSTAYHLALGLKAKGKGDGGDIVVLDKSARGAGASGIACGVVRNNYYQPAMRELMAHSVDVWESDPEAYSYHPVGYMQISPESMHEDVASIFRQQQDIGYSSTFVEGKDDCTSYMKEIFDDWQARQITSVLHEHKGGYANNQQSLIGLEGKAKALGVEVLAPVAVTSIERDASGAIKKVVTDEGSIACDYLIVGAGPWVKSLWEMLELPATVSIKNPVSGVITDNVPMWIYWSLQEGTLGVDPMLLRTNGGDMPPVIHVDSDAPLYCDKSGELITDKMWGIYYKPDFNFGGIQGGAAPFIVNKEASEVAVDPYGPESPEFVVGDDFARLWTSALAHCQKRFSGKGGLFKREPSGGIGAFTPDSFPVFDEFHQNCFVIADSNHGYKMIGVGKLVAERILGNSSSLLDPFTFSRYKQGKLHPVSSSPFPWS